jgi:uncharacterized protein
VTLEGKLPKAVVEAAGAYRGFLWERFGDRLLDVRVFGSNARGDADDDSDVDIAVIIRDLSESDRTEAIDLAFRAWKLDPSPRILSPLVWSEAELEDRIRTERRIAYDILTDGIQV